MNWKIEDLTAAILSTLREEEGGDGLVIEGRAIGVKASPLLGNSSRIAMGLSALPPGFATVPHAHEAEEIALVLSGSGNVEIEGVTHLISEGTLLMVPPGSHHVTRSDADIPLVILWFYAPPGSEARWLESGR